MRSVCGQFRDRGHFPLDKTFNPEKEATCYLWVFGDYIHESCLSCCKVLSPGNSLMSSEYAGCWITSCNNVTILSSRNNAGVFTDALTLTPLLENLFCL